MFRKVDTVEYPEVKLPTAPRFHGRHQLNRWPDGLEKCIGCELCAWACPADAIYVEGGSNTDSERYSPGERYGAVYQINYLRCILCGLCVEACPTRALTMTTSTGPRAATGEASTGPKRSCPARCCPAWNSPRTTCVSARPSGTTTTCARPASSRNPTWPRGRKGRRGCRHGR